MATFTLGEVLNALSPEDMFAVGAGSGYFFIGSVAQFNAYEELLYFYYRTSKKTDLTDLRDRKINSSFVRDIPGEPAVRMFTLYGVKENGDVWLSSELAQQIANYRKVWAVNHNGEDYNDRVPVELRP